MFARLVKTSVKGYLWHKACFQNKKKTHRSVNVYFFMEARSRGLS